MASEAQARLWVVTVMAMPPLPMFGFIGSVNFSNLPTNFEAREEGVAHAKELWPEAMGWHSHDALVAPCPRVLTVEEEKVNAG